jgi:hypothetical protein
MEGKGKSAPTLRKYLSLSIFDYSPGDETGAALPSN